MNQNDRLAQLKPIYLRLKKLVDAHEKEPIDFFCPNTIGGFQDRFTRSLKRNRWVFAGNRCLPEGSLIDTPHKQIRIEDIKEGDTVFAYDLKTKKAVETKVVGSFTGGVKPCVRIMTRTGYFDCSIDHRFLSKHPNKNKYLWRTPESIKRLTKHFTVVTPSEYIITPTPTTFPPDFFRFIGYLLGDGSFCQDCIRFTNTNPEIVKDFELTIPSELSLRRCKNEEDYFVSVKNGVKGGNWVITWLRKVGLWGHKADTKFIPEEMLYAPIEHIRELLRGLYATDGWAKENGYGFCSTSPHLLWGVIFLLQRLGIPTGVITEKKRKYKNHNILYSVSFCDHKFLHNFPDIVGKPKKIKIPQKTRHDIHCEKIVSIEPLGELQTIDIEVEHPDHTFITNGFVVHNSGKSELAAAEVVRFALGKHPYRNITTPNIGWVVSPDSNLSREIMEVKIRRLVGEHHIARWRERERIMELDNGSEIFFKSADSGVTKFTGRAIRYASLDEDIPQDIYGEVLMRTLDEEGDIWGTLTPIHSNWMYDAIFLNSYSDPEIECFFGATSENADNISRREIERIRGSFSVDEMDARLEGKFLKFAGLVYKEFNDNIHLLTPFHIPDWWPRFRFIDHGMHDPTACLWLAISPDDEYHFYREYYVRNKTIQDNCFAIKQLSGREKYVRTYIDPQTNARSAQAHFKTDFRVYADCGINPLTTWPKTEIQTKINATIARMNNRKFFVHRGLANTLKEFKNWGRDKSGQPEKGNDHALDCIGSACLINLKHYQRSDMGFPSQIPVDCLSDQQVNF